ncbi:hypothetical protein CMQ_4018 [Grosmannia clavigera kw1407]|uniref:DUF7053 domain-containing protein n=1 Tax=Grosmannia clavigera (strain kw1407 / UAMH 11150) TaxID=655863 RepID=F0X8R2_GROCL|nr:uncharacterized protein CMQ_4018 [Grosmannia clavigera kw1407]EFX05949.1 hypothetical protein CMQ_4018 [Grosmannia clavigera kw1407]
MSMLKKKELVTIITPIPGFIPRQLAIDILHSHSEVITLNPLVLEHKPIKAPRDSASDEYYSTWYEIIERIQYVPGLGRMGSGKIAFKGCFHNMPWGLQAHIYAPMSTDLRYKYRIAGNQPGIEPPETMEMGLASLGAPTDGLYLREDVEVKCSIAVMSFVKSQLKAASKKMVERIIKKAELVDSGVLHAMMDNGKLRTVNPADRSSTQPTSPTGSPSPAQRISEQDAKEQQQPQQSSARLSTIGAPGSPFMPYQVPRPHSLAGTYGSRPDSANASHGHSASGTLGPGPYAVYPGYRAYAAHPGYSGFVPPYMQGAYGQYPPHLFQAEMPGYMTPTGGPSAYPAASFAVEMPGDYYHPQAGAPPPALSVESTPRSNRDSDILATGKWAAPTDYAQGSSQRNSPALSGSRPGSVSSDAGASAPGGYRPLSIDNKGVSSELTTHRETQEEHRAEALKKLERQSAYGQQSGHTYNPAEYGRSAYGAK